jgi:phosphoesterase RecJ-like protein
MMNEKNIDELKLILASPRKIVLVPHRNPDGDAMGSVLGLYCVLIQLQHEVHIISPNEIPHFLNWMPEIDKVSVFENNEKEAMQILSQADYIFALDFNILARTGEKMEKALENTTAFKIMIDHHQMPGDFAKLIFSDTAFGSTCELLYTILKQAGFLKYINKNAAICLYTGIVTDSGSFRFPKKNSSTHSAVADLIERGIDNPQIHNALFDNNSYNRLQLLGKALQNMVLLSESKTSYIYLSENDLQQFDYQKGDTEGFVNYGLTITGIDFTAFFIERKEDAGIKISFRSQGNFDVNLFARRFFNGGGHINAAGGNSDLSLEETINHFKEIVKNHKSEFYV